jgi:hypothetical protein
MHDNFLFLHLARQVFTMEVMTQAMPNHALSFEKCVGDV